MKNRTLHPGRFLLVAALWVAACSRPSGPARLELAVTDEGFEPTRFEVYQGQPVTLVVTRKTDDTCAKEIYLDALGLHAELPLNQPVTLSFTPDKAGDLSFGCGMDRMLSGVIRVR
ncbi:MAG TPA: cupredoxin domain-containing protein [Thermoanaerobaculia bacterium]|nr:cupredoxin domain-containing protein [Thermoanaerobaculia bacterium]